MITIRDSADELADLIKSRSNISIISVDGHFDAGKTYLATTLASILQASPIDLDPYVKDKQGVFVAALRVPELASAVHRAKLVGMVIVSGVCVLDALSKIGVKPDLTVYVERRTQADIPGDLQILEAEERGDIEHLSGPLFTDFDREVARYHVCYRPLGSADVVFLRSAS